MPLDSMTRKYGNAKSPGIPKMSCAPCAFKACSRDSIRFKRRPLDTRIAAGHSHGPYGSSGGEPQSVVLPIPPFSQRAHPPGHTGSALELRTIPGGCIRGSLVGPRQEVEQEALRSRRRAHGLVGQDEFPELLVEICPGRDRASAKSRGLGVGIRVEGGGRKGVVPGPEAGAADFVRVGLPRDGVGQPWHATGMKRCTPSREARHRKVETAPKEMHRTCLAQKSGTELLQDPIGLDEGAPECVGSGGVIGAVTIVAGEGEGI